jgi:DNA recombination protein RmuC
MSQVGLEVQMEYGLFFIIGLVVGALIVFFITRYHRKDMEKTFSVLSADVLRQNTSDFVQFANETLTRQVKTGEVELEGKKRLIDQTLDIMRGDLQKVENLMREFEQDRAAKFGAITAQLEETAKQTARLQDTTGKLQTALASAKIRGQWGERIAEDVLRLAGFIEGVNYLKQQTQAESSSRPDYTFLLPQDLKLNMDVKFPLDNYMKYAEEESEELRRTYKDQFLKDARNRIKEVTGRDYINPEENTVDYVVVFIPNEQVYSFINENDHSIIDEALNNRVILCSPFTLYAILAVIRKAAENFNIRRTAGEILSCMDSFYKQWTMFRDNMDKMGKKLDEARAEYNSLLTTRSNRLEKVLTKIDNLKQQHPLPEIKDSDLTAEDSPQIEDVES